MRHAGQTRVGFGVRHDPDRHGAVINNEPDKCDALGWFRRDELPQPLEPHTEAMLHGSETSFAFRVNARYLSVAAVHRSGKDGDVVVHGG